jgi:DNA-binding NtrC family response regulator
MSPVLQSRLLRVIQEREVRRVGDNLPVYVNVRVVAATNEPLERKIKDGGFREDLYYRLNVIAIQLPSLRERHDDIPLLVGHFLREKIHPRTGQAFQVSRQAMDALCAHEWPGNVRELENAIERACALAESNLIRVADLPPVLHQYSNENPSDTVFQIRDPATGELLTTTPGSAVGTPGKAPASASPISGTAPLSTIEPLKNFVREQELAYLNRVLAHTDGNKERAAELLGVSLATLYRKLSEEPET